MAKKPDPLTPDESVNSGFTAIPKESWDGLEEAMDVGEMNEYDAREAGYIGKNGKAVSLARPNVKGDPTNALTDIGAGRSSVVRPH